MKILRIKNINTKDCIEIRADDKRIHGYKGFIKDVKVGDHITYTNSDTMLWRNTLVIEIKESAH